ncbi:MAG TPA: hypothetical protein VFQ45_08860 [Longimicrobium sp.]|nr:hypothetical protein [Longimicrobium sp.]
MPIPLRPALLAALLLAAPAAAQHSRTHTNHNGEVHIVDSRNGERLEIAMRGQVEFNDEGDWVESVSPGGRLLVEERRRGMERRMEFTDGDRGVRIRYWVNGDARQVDAGAREWARARILEAVRESGFGAEQRVARIRAGRGVNGVLEEIGRIRNDTGRRMYYLALLDGPRMTSAEFARVMDDVGRRIGSDTETRLVLHRAADQASDGTRTAALLRALRSVESDVETRLVLHRVAEGGRLRDDASRQAFFAALENIGSDTERRLVLHRLAEGGLDAALRPGFFDAVSEFSSDTERRLVLSAVMRGDAPEAVIVDAIQAAGEMRSDTEKRLVLSQVPSSRMRSQRVTDAYRAVVRTMRSDSERSLALRRLAGDY